MDTKRGAVIIRSLSDFAFVLFSNENLTKNLIVMSLPRSLYKLF